MTKTNYSISQKNVSTQTTLLWREQLHVRGISDEAIARAGIRPDGQGWSYPVAPGISARRWKAFPGHHGAKYRWQPAQPDHVRFYDPRGDLAGHIAAAGGVLIIANGEPAVWACWSAGVYNVTCWLGGEMNTPGWLIPELRELEAHTVLYPADCDKTGIRSAAKLRRTLHNSGITLRALGLPFAQNSKADLNDLWLMCEQNAACFAAALAACPDLDLPTAPTDERPAAEATQRDHRPGESNGLYERWCTDVVEQTAIRVWGIAPPNSKNLSRRNFSSPFREDKRPSAQWDYTRHGFKDYATGEFYNTHTVATLLGVPAWEEFRREHAIPVSRPATRRQQPLEKTIQPVALPDFQAHQTVQMRYISDLPVDDVLRHRAVLIKSPLGTGKTELVKRLIASLDRHGKANILVITHRQALAADTARRLGLECYKSIPDQFLPLAYRLVITYNSLHKISASDRRWDLVVIDEIEQFHQHLFGDTFRGGEAYRAYRALLAVLHQADHLIGLDAHLTDISAQWAHIALQNTPYLIQNTYQHNWGDLTLHSREDSVIAAALKAAQDRRGPVVITTSSRQRSEVYYRLVCETLGPEGVMLVNGENSSRLDIQRFIDRINTDLPKLRVLICTPSFGTGLDVTAHVYGVFGVMLNRPLIATDMLQMLGRFRNAGQRHVYVQPLHQTERRDWQTRQAEALDAAAETHTAAAFTTFKVPPPTAAQQDVLRLAAQLASAADVQKTDLVSYFAAYAAAEGFTLQYQEGAHHPTRQAIHTTQKTLAEERKVRTLASLPVTREEYERHQEGGTLTPEVIAGYERHKIENTVGLDITAALYDDLHTPAHRAALRQLADLLTKTERLKMRDRQEANDQVLLTQRGHYTTSQALITDILTTVFGIQGLRSDAELTGGEIATRLKPFLDEHLPQVQRMVDRRDDLSTDPTFVLRRTLKRIGLKLERRQVMVNGERFMVYWIEGETRDRWLGYAQARLAHLAAIERITTYAEGESALRVYSNKAGQTGPPAESLDDLLPIVGDIMRGRPASVLTGPT